MFQKHLKTTAINIDGQRYEVLYFEQETLRGVRRFSCEVELGAADRIILDDDSMGSLESRVARLVPATIYSRRLVARQRAA